MLLKNKLTVITGSNGGIGKKIIEKFTENGSDIIACVRKKDEKFSTFVQETMTKNNVNIEEFYFDLNNIDETTNAMNKISDNKKKIDILVSNAADISTKIFLLSDLNLIRKLFEVNFFSQALILQKILKNMLRQKTGSIINISSSSEIFADPGRSVYASSKAAFSTLLRSVSKEIGKSEIRINTIAPGLIDTKMLFNNTSKETIDKVLSNLSIKRVGTPDEVAKVALFLASDLSSYITGETINVNGGM